MTTPTIAPAATDKPAASKARTPRKPATVKAAGTGRAAPASKVTTAPAVPPAPAAPAAPQVTDQEVMSAEMNADVFIGQMGQAGVSAAPHLVTLYLGQAWKRGDKPTDMRDYFMNRRGIGGDHGVKMPKAARQAIVAEMARRAPDAQNGHIVLLTGASLKTITNDRSELAVANPNRQAAQSDRTDNAPGANGSGKSGGEKVIATLHRQALTLDDIKVIRAELDKMFAALVAATTDAATAATAALTPAPATATEA